MLTLIQVAFQDQIVGNHRGKTIEGRCTVLGWRRGCLTSGPQLPAGVMERLLSSSGSMQRRVPVLPCRDLTIQGFPYDGHPVSRGQGLKSLDGLGAGRILMDLPIGGNHRVVGGRGKLNTGSKEGDGAVIATCEQHGSVRREPGFPNGIGKRPSLWVKIAHGVVGSRDGPRLLFCVSKDDATYIFIQASRIFGSLWMLPRMLSREQEGYALMGGRRGFFLPDLPPCGEWNGEVRPLPERPPLWQV
jgi:hypothetical protein